MPAPIRLVFLLAALCVLAGCERAPADARESPAPTEVTGDNCLARLSPATLSPPLRAVHAQALDVPAADAAALACIAQVFDAAAVLPPRAFDAAPAGVDPAALRWTDLEPGRVQLVRLVQTGAYAFWLLRADAAAARHDVLFTSDAQGALLDALHAGDASGAREFDLPARGGFVVHDGGHTRAFRVDDAGRFVRDADIAPPAADAQAPDDAATTSIETVDGAPGDAEPVRALLFSDSGVLEESITPQPLGDGRRALLAIGRSDIADFIVYVFVPTPEQPDAKHARYRVVSRVLPQPDGVLDGRIALAGWQVAPDGVAAIALDLQHDLPRADGDPASGEPDTQPHSRRLVLRYDPRNDALEPIDG